MTLDRSKRWSHFMKKPVLLLLMLIAGIVLCGCVGTKDLLDDGAAASELVDA
jgi:hypothetical protein